MEANIINKFYSVIEIGTQLGAINPDVILDSDACHFSAMKKRLSPTG